MSYGRRRIYTDAAEITAGNVLDEVNKAFLVHSQNRAEINKLYEYYKNKTAILAKEKEFRENINNKVSEARCLEITNFYKGYIFGEPIQYVRREKSQHNVPDDTLAAAINALNSYMTDANKHSVDSEVGKWMLIAGVGYKMILPNPKWQKGGDEAPFEVYSRDPRNSFIVRGRTIEETPLMSVTYTLNETKEPEFYVYTPESFFVCKQGEIVKEDVNRLGYIPMTEYAAADYLGVFEPVIPLVDAINSLQSNRMDDVVQYVNSFLAILGAQVDEDTYAKLSEWKMLCLPEGSDAKYLSVPLTQSDVQTFKQDLLQAILTVTGVPNRNGGSSTSDTGQAVELRDGWSSAETRAKDIETAFSAAERGHLKIALKILRDSEGTALKLSDIETHFTRRNYENIATKSQVLISMLSNPWVHPEVAYASSGLFADPESAYLQGKAWYEEQERRANEKKVQGNNPKAPASGEGGTE